MLKMQLEDTGVLSYGPGRASTCKILRVRLSGGALYLTCFITASEPNYLFFKYQFSEKERWSAFFQVNWVDIFIEQMTLILSLFQIKLTS